MANKLFLIFLITFSLSTILSKTIPKPKDYCLNQDPNPYLYFGTKTPYEAVRGDNEFLIECTPIQIWLISRHGTRFATKGNMAEMKAAIRLREEILQNYESAIIEDGLCEEDLAALKEWSWDESAESMAGLLNEQGWKDLYLMAKRFQGIYPSLFDAYSAEKYYFRHTLSERTQESCYAFIDGLFGDGFHGQAVVEEPNEVDMIIKPYDNCQAWKEDIDDNDDTLLELLNFIESPPYKKLQSAVSKRLGFTNRTLTPIEIEAMYDNCRLDKSRRLDDVSAWCSAFSPDDLRLLEYENDLERFYKSGPSHAFNKRLGCPPLKHLRDTFEATVAGGNSSNRAITVAMFTHDSMLDMTFAALGYNDGGFNLTGSDYEDVLGERVYRTSFTVPFSANMAAVLHRCPVGPDPYVVQLIHNEKPMELAGCPRGLCSWDRLKELLSFAEECDLSFCDRENHTTQNMDCL